MSVKANHRDKLERLCRYISRPAVSTHRISIMPDGKISYELKTPYRNGTTHIIFEPLDFISKLAALVPVPRVNLTRFHGIFAPNSKHRASITPNQNDTKKTAVDYVQTKSEKRAAMTWAQRLKRAFNIDIETCEACGSAVKIIACIDDPVIIKKILQHRDQQFQKNHSILLPVSRAPPCLLLN